jgi:hypothetical protein
MVLANDDPDRCDAGSSPARGLTMSKTDNDPDDETERIDQLEAVVREQQRELEALAETLGIENPREEAKKYSRRAALGLGAAGVAGAAGYATGSAQAQSQPAGTIGDGDEAWNVQSVDADRLVNVADHIVGSVSDLTTAVSNLSVGDTVYLGRPNTPYRITQWLDIDTDDVTIIAQNQRAANGEPIIKVADGANVGGFRVGTESATTGVEFRNIGFHGNPQNQDSTVKRLHAWTFEDAASCELIGCFATRTSPYREHNSGGSGYTCRSQATNITFRDCETDDIGDRGWQLAGSGHTLIRPKTRNGYDRSVSLDVQLPDSSWDGADDVTIRGGDFDTNTDGSIIAVREYGAHNIAISDCKIRGTYRGAIQQDNASCQDWIISDIDVKHTGADLSQPGLILESGTTVDGGRMIEDSATGWDSPVAIRGRAEVEGLTVDIRNTDVSGQVVGTSGSEPFDWRGGKIICGAHGSGFNIDGACPGSTIVGVTIDEFGNGSGVGAAARVNAANVKVSDVTGLTANSPRAFIAWDKPSGVCSDNYDRSSASTHYDFAASPDFEADNTP